VSANAALLLVGAPTPYEEELRSLAADRGVAERVRFLGYVSEEELEGLYRLAACFALPSLIEGFGLPVLEAMIRDVPVACSNRPALPEVAGDAALLFDPERPEEIAAAVNRLLDDAELAAELVARGRARCRRFTWERTAEATLTTYRRAVEKRQRRR
jgi:glycosyltransferase involved in cell wall biosynthesis